MDMYQLLHKKHFLLKIYYSSSYGAPETRREFMAHKLYKFLQKYVQNIDKVSKKHKK